MTEPAPEFTPPTVEEAGAWMDRQLERAEITRTGPVTLPYIRPWSAVFTAATSQGAVWLKVPAAGSEFEAGLYEILLQVAPDNVLEPIASETGNGWLLLPDGGPALAEIARGEALVDAMTRALPQYAALQRAVSDQSGALLQIGLTDMRTGSLPERFERVVMAMRPPPEPLVELIPVFEGWCSLLEDHPVAPSLDHNDLHPWNVLGFGSDGRLTGSAPVFYDWGDSVVGHPLGSSAEPIGRVRLLAGLASDDPEVLRMRDAYLEVFDEIVSGEEARELVQTAWRVARAARAVIWDGSQQDVDRYLDRLARGELDL
jgi:hypothetical protein